MGFRLGPASSGKNAGGVPWQWILALGAAVGVCVVGWLAGRGIIGAPSPEPVRDLEIDPRPVITSLQELGELHTAKMTMKDVLRKASDRPAEGWVRGVPGGDAVTRWATHNEVLVVAEGSVEAGIDLAALTAHDVTQVHLANGAPGLRVHLPRPVVYSPNVTLRVEKSESGFMWKDENLIPKAQAEAVKRFRETAEKGGIREQAEEHAVAQLKHIGGTLGLNNVEFYY